MQEIKLDKGRARIESVCVNSKHKASFLANEGEDCCECSFGECKVNVEIEYNGHDFYNYVLTEKEIKDLPTSEKAFNTMMGNPIEQLEKLTIK